MVEIKGHRLFLLTFFSVAAVESLHSDTIALRWCSFSPRFMLSARHRRRKCITHQGGVEFDSQHAAARCND